MAIELDTVRQRLLALRAELVADVERWEADSAPVELDQDRFGRLSRIDALQMQEMALAARHRRRAEIDKIDTALRRIDADDFGYCARCGDAIAIGRLQQSPFVTTCIECARC